MQKARALPDEGRVRCVSRQHADGPRQEAAQTRPEGVPRQGAERRGTAGGIRPGLGQESQHGDASVPVLLYVGRGQLVAMLQGDADAVPSPVPTIPLRDYVDCPRLRVIGDGGGAAARRTARGASVAPGGELQKVKHLRFHRVRHIQMPGLAQHQVRHDQREAVCKTAHRARTWGTICAAAVTPDRANDSPYLREMLARMPRGSGDMLADAQYGGVENCQVVQDSGRRPVIEPRSDYTIEGEDARAQMLRFFRNVRHIPQVVAETEQRRERLLVHEGKVRGRGAGSQDKCSDRRVAVHLHTSQHDFRMRVAARGRRRPRT